MTAKMLQPIMDFNALQKRFAQIRGTVSDPPDASIAIPVNAQGDLQNVLRILSDIARYAGPHSFEMILVINNYPPGEEPPEIEQFQNMGIEVLSEPNMRIVGEAIGFTARFCGVRVANTEYVILFDADCRIPNATALINWYIDQFQRGAKVAYTHVAYYELRNRLSIKFRIFVHHASRWFKRAILRIPTTRGSNYAVHRSTALKYYDEGFLADEMNVGPVLKNFGEKVAYSGSKDLIVLTSGRVFSGGWLKLVRYLIYRLRYNLRVLPVRNDAAQRTKRESDPIQRYVDNVPVRDDDS
jgi:hypothetical protein